MCKINVCSVYSKRDYFYLFAITWLNMYIKILQTYHPLYSCQLQRTQVFYVLKNVKYFGVLLLLD